MHASAVVLALSPILSSFQDGLTLDFYLHPLTGLPDHTCTLSWVEERKQYEAARLDGGWVLKAKPDGTLWALARGDGGGGTWARYGSAIGLYGDERTGLARPPGTLPNCRIR